MKVKEKTSPLKESHASSAKKRGHGGSITSFSPGGVPEKHSSLFQKMSIHLEGANSNAEDNQTSTQSITSMWTAF